MFTGLIEEVGRVRSIDGNSRAMQLIISAQQVLTDTTIGDSIAVNGVCLTVTRLGKEEFEADVMPETMDKTSLRRLRPGSPVNLERALAAGERFGGHFVQGHVDGVGRIRTRTPVENAVLFEVEVPETLTQWMVDKGSVVVNGISLTLVTVTPRSFTVSIIPHTLTHTQLQNARPGDEVNIECDMIGKYVAKLLQKQQGDSMSEVLKQAGLTE
ncbi:riboflavin synthase [Desmospora activa]|uniref:Riboflavin synthase n=1 Tax=Desmospora activa DSM 45169 TaxID=1121389 RepID=A0A2T4Z9S1_9BACL|nr:riboflavin synthase [Desmospora activa]PTM58627.1 riboflavin synthase alpha chain [Desmospora activa DSM 45169]